MGFGLFLVSGFLISAFLFVFGVWVLGLCREVSADDVFWLIESPRWLLKKYRIKDSFTSFCRLRNSEVQAARDLVCFHSIIYMEESKAD